VVNTLIAFAFALENPHLVKLSISGAVLQMRLMKSGSILKAESYKHYSETLLRYSGRGSVSLVH